MGGGNFIPPKQGDQMGGADKPAGAHGENTFQNKEIRQLVILVRFKPKPPDNDPFADMSAAQGMLQSVTGAIDSAVSGVEDAMSNIPGLKMFIKEKKKDSTSKKDYEYTYADWDTKFAKVGPNLQKLNPNSKTDTFDFNSTDVKGRKTDAQTLLSKINSTISGWTGYRVWVHLIGVGQGGNVVNECTDLLSKDGTFNSQKKWLLKSVIYVGAATYKNEHILNHAALKEEGAVFSFGNSFDLTENGVDYFEPRDKLVQMIKDSNKNTISLTVGKIQLRVIKILTLVLGGLNISIGNQSDLKKFDMIKAEIEGMINDTIDIIKKIAADTAAFIKLGDLPEFSKIMDGYSEIPNQSKAILEKFLSDLGDQATDQVKHVNVSLGPQDLAGVLNCLCPLFDHLTDSLSIFKYESKTSADLAQQIIDSAGIATVYAPAEVSDEDISTVDPHYKKSTDLAVKNAKGDAAFAYVSKAKTLIAKATENGSDIKSFSADQKIAVAEALYHMARPMMVSKEQVYEELLGYLDGFMHFDQLFKKINASTLMGIPAEKLKVLNIDYPPDLQTSIGKTDDELNRIKGYFYKDNFGLQEDSQYLIFDSHNAVFNKMPDAVSYCIDRQTTFLDYQKASGQDNTFPDNGTYDYKPAGSGEKENVMPAQQLPVK